MQDCAHDEVEIDILKMGDTQRDFGMREWRKWVDVVNANTPFQKLIQLMRRPDSNVVCATVPITTSKGRACLTRLLSKHAITKSQWVRAGPHDVIDRMDSLETSIAVMCGRGEIVVFDAAHPSYAQRNAVLQCMNVAVPDTQEFSALFDRAYEQKKRDDEMRCDRGDRIMQRTFEAYRAIQNYYEIPLVWRQFYTGQLCTISYGSDFVGNESGDNVHADKAIAKQFYDITTWCGLLPFDSQIGHLEDRQKAYIMASVDDYNVARYIADEINRQNGMIAFATNASGWCNYFAKFPKDAFQLDMQVPIGVTYEPGPCVKRDRSSPPQICTKTLHGQRVTAHPVSGVPQQGALHYLLDDSEFQVTQRVKEQLQKQQWFTLNMIDTDFTRNILLDTLHRVVKEKYAPSQ